MAASKPDVILSSNKWTELYAATGLDVGTAIRFQNKTGGDLLVFESATAPAADARDGEIFADKERVVVTAGSPGVWVFSTQSSGRVYVQTQEV